MAATGGPRRSNDRLHQLRDPRPPSDEQVAPPYTYKPEAADGAAGGVGLLEFSPGGRFLASRNGTLAQQLEMRALGGAA